jgi:UDP-glucose 4-epimerase
LAGGSRISLFEVLSIIEKITEKKANIEHIESQKGDVRDTYGDISKAKKILSYEPKVGIREGLKKYIEKYKSQ